MKKSGLVGRLLGYARVSTEDQGTDPQSYELRLAGCDTVFEECGSGADRSRPVLTGLLRDIRSGDTLVVVRLDRLARSLGHLLEVIESLEERGAHFRSLRDPVDTSTPQGMFSLQVMGAVAQLERALIAERTKAGLKVARASGRIGGNPGLRSGDPEAIEKARTARAASHMTSILSTSDSWLPVVKRLRPDETWGDVVRVLNQGAGETWTIERLRRTVRHLVDAGIVDRGVLAKSRPKDGKDRLVSLVRGIRIAAPEMTFGQIASQLEAMKERTPRGGTRWHPSSVRHLLSRKLDTRRIQK